jgi:serine/threonine protein kinase
LLRAHRDTLRPTVTLRLDQLLLDIPGLCQAAPMHQWKPTWEQLQAQYCAALRSVELADEEDRREAEAYMAYEFKTQASRPLDNRHKALPRWFTPRYLVKFGSHIASGAFGSVRHGKLLGADVVIKELNSGCTTADEWQQFRRELGLWFSLNHENLIKLYGACDVGLPFFVCERATQGTLVSALKQNDKWNVWVMLWYAAKGLEHLHDNGIIHGDLKGNNILVCEGDMFKRPIAKLADFGLSVLANGKTSGEQGARGAYRWKAPECLDGAPPSFASDIYSFGVCVVEAVSGQFPWGNTLDDRVVKYYVTKRRELLPLPPQLQGNKWKLIERMCAFDPDERINAGAVVHILLRMSQQTQGSEL